MMVDSRNLDLLTIGLVLDMWTEKANDGVKYRRIADQSDFDRFDSLRLKCAKLCNSFTHWEVYAWDFLIFLNRRIRISLQMPR